MKYPDNCIQCLYEPWWVSDQAIGLGSLLYAIVPYFQQQPTRLTPTARPIPTSHGEATVSIEVFNIDRPAPQSGLPVAALTLQEKEMLLTFVAKVRPVIVLVDNYPLTQGVAHQKIPTMLVAPYFSTASSACRAGFPSTFIAEVKKGNYAQYLWDQLPLKSPPTGSLLRFDRAFCMPKLDQGKKGYYKPTGYRLSSDALECYIQWFEWSIRGELKKNCRLYEAIDLLQAP